MSTHPITDIHDTEKEALKMIEEAKKRNQNKIIQTRELEEKKFEQFEEEGKTAGKEKLAEAKEAAAKICKEKLSIGEKEIQTMIKAAEQRQEQGVRNGLKAFGDYVNVAL